MADVKISALTNLGTAPANDDELVIVDKDGGGASGTTKKVTVSDLLSSAGSALTVTDGGSVTESSVSQITVGTGLELVDDATDGHVTINSTVTDTNTTYDLASAQSGSNATITLSGSDATSDVVTLAAGSNVTLTDNGSNQITITAATSGSATTINNNADNRVITGSNTANTLEGEANLLYDAGVLDIKNAGVQSEVKLYCESANSHFVSLKAPAHAAISPGGSYTLTLPAAYAASNGQVLSSTTAGSLSWTSDITGNAAGLSQTLAVTSGGTGLATVPQGSVLVANTADTLTALEGVTDGHVLTYNSGTDTVSWSAPSGGSGTSLDGQKLEYIVSSSALTAAGDYEGLVLKVGDAGNTLTAGTVYYFDATQTDWVAADNTAEGTAKGVLGIALGASGTTDGVLIQGVYYYADAAGVTGDVLFLGTSGAMTATAPTSDGEILRVMGQNIDNNIVMFQPSQDFIELGAAAATTSIDDLSDVDTTTVAPTDGQALVWDNTAQQWEPGTVSGGSFDLVNDTTPQLGGDLDVNGNSIVSTTNGNIAITPDGTGAVVLDGLSYPTADGAANQPLITNGSGVISFGSTVKATLQGPVDGSDLDVKIETSAATAAGDGEGVVVYFGTGATVAGKVYTFSSGSWVAVSAATGGEATTKGLLAMALSNSGPSGGMLLYGVGFIDHAHGGSPGSVLYVGDGATAGEITATQPAASTEYVRVVGHAITTSDAAGSKIFFSPSQDWIEIA